MHWAERGVSAWSRQFNPRWWSFCFSFRQWEILLDEQIYAVLGLVECSPVSFRGCQVSDVEGAVQVNAGRAAGSDRGAAVGSITPRLYDNELMLFMLQCIECVSGGCLLVTGPLVKAARLFRPKLAGRLFVVYGREGRVLRASPAAAGARAGFLFLGAIRRREAGGGRRCGRCRAPVLGLRGTLRTRSRGGSRRAGPVLS